MRRRFPTVFIFHNIHSRPQCLRVWECALMLWEILRRSSQNLAILASQRMLFDRTKTCCFFYIYFIAKVLCFFGIRTEEIQLTALKNFQVFKALVVAAEKIPLNVPIHRFETWSLHMLDSWLNFCGLLHFGRPSVSKLWQNIRAFFPHVYLQSFLLDDIRAFFCHVYLRSFLLCGVFIPKYMTIFLQTRIYMRTKKPIYMRYKQACGIWGHRKSSYKRHRIIPSAKNPFMYDGAEK